MKRLPEESVLRRNSTCETCVVVKNGLLINAGVFAIEKPRGFKYSNVRKGQSQPQQCSDFSDSIGQLVRRNSGITRREDSQDADAGKFQASLKKLQSGDQPENCRWF